MNSKMMKVVIKTAHKSIPAELSFTLPKFSIITGLNGSGKTHLLEAMSNPNIAELAINGQVIHRITHIPYNTLSPLISETCDNNSIVDTIQMHWSDVFHHLHILTMNNFPDIPSDDILDVHLAPLLGAGSPAILAVKRFIKRTGKKPTEMTLSDFHKFMDFSTNEERLFASQCATAFKLYQNRRFKNEVSEYFASKYPDRNISFLSSDDFLEFFGPPPWELLNSVLIKSGLPYRFNSPSEDDPELPYTLRLIDQITGKAISVNELSSGEKVIMALVLAIYNTSEGSTKDQVLLLDEPDAPLHPNFSKLLIETITESIANKAGVTVVMSTHSPTTAALAPEHSLFELDRSSKILTMISNHHAIKILTKGIEHLKVSYENRRQIFVEGRYDVEYYTKIFRILNRDNRFNYNPVFVEPHSGNANCVDVIDIVSKLRNSGSDLAWGIIDYDNKNKSDASVLVLGNNKRYAIDNYILDPIYVCLALIRNRKKSYSDFGILTGKCSYIDATELSNNECQIMIDSFLAQCGICLSSTEITYCENGFELNYPIEFLRHNGHDYEKLIIKTFPELHGIKKNNRESGLKLAVLEVIEDFRGFMPKEISETLDLIR